MIQLYIQDSLKSDLNDLNISIQHCTFNTNLIYLFIFIKNIASYPSQIFY